MKILFVIGPLKSGGAERVVANLSNEFVKNNSVFIATTVDENSDYIIDKNVKIICLDDGKKNNFFKKNIIRIKNLKKLINEEKIDIAISFLPEPSYRLMIAKNNKIKTIISERNDPNIEYNSFIKKILTKLLYCKADGFIFQTEDAKKWFSKKIQKKSIVIPNPINEKFISNAYYGKREKTIVNVGRLVKQKNQKMLIDAFNEVHKKHNEYILKIYGDGELYDELKKQIKNLKLEDYVFLMGKKNDIKKEIYKSGIFVLSSDYEGMPNSLMEAMALGIPCISTDCPIGGPNFLIENNKNGLLFQVNNKDELVANINLLIENEQLAKELSNNANKICEILNPKIINRKWREYIEEVVKK